MSEGPVRLQFLKLTVETPTGRKLVPRMGQPSHRTAFCSRGGVAQE